MKKKKDVVKFEEGFKFKCFKFGWLGGKLFRLPNKLHDREYSMREVPVIDITKTIKGYRLIREKKSVNQVMVMIKKVSYNVKLKQCPQCPGFK